MKIQFIVIARVEENHLAETLSSLAGLTVGDPRVKIAENNSSSRPAASPKQEPDPDPKRPSQQSYSGRVSFSKEELTNKFIEYVIFIKKDWITNQDIERFITMNGAAKSSTSWYAGRLMEFGIIAREGYEKGRPRYVVMKKKV